MKMNILFHFALTGSVSFHFLYSIQSLKKSQSNHTPRALCHIYNCVHMVVGRSKNWIEEK